MNKRANKSMNRWMNEQTKITNERMNEMNNNFYDIRLFDLIISVSCIVRCDLISLLHQPTMATDFKTRLLVIRENPLL